LKHLQTLDLVTFNIPQLIHVMMNLANFEPLTRFRIPIIKQGSLTSYHHRYISYNYLIFSSCKLKLQNITIGPSHNTQNMHRSIIESNFKFWYSVAMTISSSLNNMPWLLRNCVSIAICLPKQLGLLTQNYKYSYFTPTSYRLLWKKNKGKQSKHHAVYLVAKASIDLQSWFGFSWYFMHILIACRLIYV